MGPAFPLTFWEGGFVHVIQLISVFTWRNRIGHDTSSYTCSSPAGKRPFPNSQFSPYWTDSVSTRTKQHLRVPHSGNIDFIHILQQIVELNIGRNVFIFSLLLQKTKIGNFGFCLKTILETVFENTNSIILGSLGNCYYSLNLVFFF